MAQREFLDPPFTTLQFLHKRAHESLDKLELNPSTAQHMFCLTSRFTQRPYELKEPWPYYFSMNTKGVDIIAYYIFCLEEFLLASKLFIEKVQIKQGDLGVQSMDPDMMWLRTMVDDALVARLAMFVREFYYRDYSKYESMHDLSGFSGFREACRNKLKDELQKREMVAREKSRTGQVMTPGEVRILENLRHRDNKETMTRRQEERKLMPGDMLKKYLLKGNDKWGSRKAAEERAFWVFMMSDKDLTVGWQNLKKNSVTMLEDS